MSIWHDKLKESGKKLMVISGGQRGADAGSLAAAFDIGLPTGGMAPKGWRTKNGPNPTLAKLGLVESTSSNYSNRTYDNVKQSDGTIILSYDFTSAGTRLTEKAVGFYSKPLFKVDLNDKDFIFDIVFWINENQIKVLNCAGNGGKTKAEGTAIFNQVRQHLRAVFRAYKGE